LSLPGPFFLALLAHTHFPRRVLMLTIFPSKQLFAKDLRPGPHLGRSLAAQLGGGQGGRHGGAKGQSHGHCYEFAGEFLCRSARLFRWLGVTGRRSSESLPPGHPVIGWHRFRGRFMSQSEDTRRAAKAQNILNDLGQAQQIPGKDPALHANQGRGGALRPVEFR